MAQTSDFGLGQVALALAPRTGRGYPSRLSAAPGGSPDLASGTRPRRGTLLSLFCV